MRRPKVVLAITIDTERDCSPTWHTSDPLAFTSITTGIYNHLQPLLNQYGAAPTYLLSPEVIEDETCVGIFKKMEGDFEVGTHMHGEYLEPEKIFQEYAGTLSSAIQYLYPEVLESAKLTRLTRLFEKAFDHSPLSFRAGRFAADGNTLSLLATLGYKVDTSVTPHVLWNYPEGAVDFSSAPEHPYFPSVDDINQPGCLDILEVPVTIDQFILSPSSWVKSLSKSRFSNLPKVRYFFKPLWLRPSFHSARQMITLIERFITRYQNKPIIFLNMMFHSMELMPGKSPYILTEKDSFLFIKKIQNILEYCTKTKIGFARLIDVYEANQ